MLAPFSATSSICQYLAPNTAHPELVEGLPFLLLDFREQGRPFDKLRVSGVGETIRRLRELLPKPSLTSHPNSLFRRCHQRASFGHTFTAFIIGV
jgi:hypothetical protein